MYIYKINFKNRRYGKVRNERSERKANLSKPENVVEGKLGSDKAAVSAIVARQRRFPRPPLSGAVRGAERAILLCPANESRAL